MDQKDCQIIEALQRDGRLTNLELSQKVNLSPSPCLRRVRALEEAGVISGYTAIVSEEAYGLPVTVFVRIRLEKHTASTVRRFEDAVNAIPDILDCYMMTGSSDYLLRVLVPSLHAYEDFVRQKLHAIPAIASIDSSFAYGVVKRSPVFPRAHGAFL